MGEYTAGSIGNVLVCKQDSRRNFQRRTVGKSDDLRLDGVWRTFQDKMFFSKVLGIINGQVKVSRKWQEDLKRAAVLVGQSQVSNDVAQAFLWNMIALELLLTNQQDKHSDALPKRIEAFLGWVGFWEDDDYEAQIAEAYRKRCLFVHDGKRDEVSIEDLLFTDDLVLNLLSNLTHHSRLFTSKQDVVDFADRVECERKLGVRPKVRPGTLHFISRKYEEKDYEEI